MCYESNLVYTEREAAAAEVMKARNGQGLVQGLANDRKVVWVGQGSVGSMWTFNLYIDGSEYGGEFQRCRKGDLVLIRKVKLG